MAAVIFDGKTLSDGVASESKAIAAEKDVTGFHVHNVGRLMIGEAAVGPMTVIMLMANTIRATEMRMAGLAR